MSHFMRKKNRDQRKRKGNSPQQKPGTCNDFESKAEETYIAIYKE